MPARLFELHHAGGEVIADGVEFPDDLVIVHWRTGGHNTSMYREFSHLAEPGLVAVWAEP